MSGELLQKGRLRYIHLNKKFLEEVENGASWEALQPLVEEMKMLAVYLHQLPTTVDVITHLNIHPKEAGADQAADVQEPLV